MKALVIYDSAYGNTEKIAQAIAAGLGASAEVELLQVSKLSPGQLPGADLLVVGSPTQRFRPTLPITGLLKALPPKSLAGVQAAAFDTRLALDEIQGSALRFIVKSGGYAAKPIAERLRKAGARLAAPPEGFLVRDTEGPLLDGEIERAGQWARSLLAAR